MFNQQIMLKNIFYTGVFKFEGKIYENANHKPIISKELFYKVQEMLLDPRKVRSHNVKFPYINLIKCADCGCCLTAELKKKKYVYYHCTGNRGGTCKKDYIREEKIEKAIAEILKHLVFPNETIQNLKKALSKVHAQKTDYSTDLKNKLQKRINDLERRIETSYNHFLDGVIAQDRWQTNNEKWQFEKDKLYIRLQEISKIDKQFYEQSNSVLNFANDTYTWFLKGNAEQKRKIVKIVCSNLSYKDKKLDIDVVCQRV